MSHSRIDVTVSESESKLDRSARIRLRWEIWIVLALAIIPSSLYAIISLAERATRETAIGDQTTTLNASRDARPVFDALLQLMSVATDLVPVALAIWLLWSPAVSGFRRLGLDTRQPLRDIGQGSCSPPASASLGSSSTWRRGPSDSRSPSRRAPRTSPGGRSSCSCWPRSALPSSRRSSSWVTS